MYKVLPSFLHLHVNFPLQNAAAALSSRSVTRSTGAEKGGGKMRLRKGQEYIVTPTCKVRVLSLVVRKETLQAGCPDLYLVCTNGHL